MDVLEAAEVRSPDAAEWHSWPGSEGNGMSLAAFLSGVLRPRRREHTFCLWALGFSVFSDLFLVSDLPIPVAPTPALSRSPAISRGTAGPGPASAPVYPCTHQPIPSQGSTPGAAEMVQACLRCAWTVVGPSLSQLGPRAQHRTRHWVCA